MADKSEREKPRTPESLQKLLTVDKVLTKTFCDMMDKFLPYTKYRKHYKFLEYSCHALPWFFACLGALWLLWNEDLFQTQVNLLFALTIDCIVISITKAAVRRRRPAGNTNDMFLTVGIDAYSFPSGHVSRAVMITYFTVCITQSNVILSFAAILWAAAISVSRILMKRHHILDVLGGVFVGLAEGWLISHLWLSRATSVWLVNYLSDEAVNLEGLQDDQPLVIDA
uniref:Presqualene diphosphate phosphatase n=1 Tax=Lygus hesperus TaxID=30085 RepID=A0A146M4M8_LYGHE